MFGMMAIFGGLVIVNIIGLTSTSSSCFFNDECVRSSNELIIAILALGIVAFILCIAYFIAVPIKVQGFGARRYGTHGQVAYGYNGTQPVYPQNLAQQPYVYTNSVPVY